MTITIGMLAAAAIFGLTRSYFHDRNVSYTGAQKEADNLASLVKGTALEGWTYKDVVGQLYDKGDIDEKTYTETINALNNLGGDELTIGSQLKYWGNSNTTNKKLDELFSDLARKTPNLLNDYKKLTSMTDDELAAAFSSPAVNVPSPQLFSNAVEGERFQVHDPRLLSGQEMADLHGINYDPSYYYDLIKQGTQANVELGKFTGKQIENASNWDNEATLADYLGSVQNAKSSAIANGATAGARAAAEILANKENMNTKLQNTVDTADARFSAIDNYLQADARARITAREYFDRLAQIVSTDAAKYYTNDVDAYASEVGANGNMEAADWHLWGNRQYANGMMLGAQAQHQATADGANAVANEYNTVFNINYKANLERGLDRDTAIANAWKTTEDFILANSTGGNATNWYDYANAQTAAYKPASNFISYNLKRGAEAAADRAESNYWKKNSIGIGSGGGGGF